MNQNPNHPPRPGVRRFVHESSLTQERERGEFAAMVKAITVCGLAADLVVENAACGGIVPRFILYATRRVRSARNEK